MRRELYIDGTDVYESYGVWITEGGYDGLLSFPALVAPDKNVWPEEDGIEVDLENPVLSGKELTIPFVASDPAMDVDEFVTFVARPGYRTVRVPALGREWRLRLLSEPSRVTYGRTADRLVSFSLRFADDFPLREDVYPAAQGGGVALPESPYSLDGVALDTYGVMVEEGRDSALKSAAVRQNLTRKLSTMDGVLYDADTVVFSEKDVTLKCLMVTDTMERFWKCYIAFFNDLIQPGERYLGYGETGKSYKCHYKSTSGWSLVSLSGRVMVGFSLTLVFTAFRGSGDVTYLLATEDGALVTTEEDGRFIDMSLTRKTVAPVSYAPTLSVDEPLPASAGDSLPAEILKRKISEMPEGASLDNMIVPVVNKATNRNYHIPAKSIWYAGLPGARRLPELTDVDDGVDNATDGDILLRERDRWVHADPSSVLPPPVIRSLSIVGRFDTYDDLEAAFPGGPEEDGIYAVGTQPPYDYYAWSLVDGLWRWDGQGRLQMPDAYLRLFREITPGGNKITVNAATTRYAMVTLSGESVIYGLTITNATDGDEGYILVFQTGFKQLSLSKGILGTVDLPLKDGTVAMLIYNKVGGTIYIRTHVILGDVEFPTPQRVKDFQVVYYDSSSCTVQWTAPWANNIYDKGTIYDMRYANSPANADDPKVWAGLRQVEGVPLPSDPGTLQRMTITGLAPNKEYYVYLKTIRTNYGVEYLSDASDFAYFRTIGSEDMSRAYRLTVTPDMLSEQYSNHLKDSDGNECDLSRMVDETGRNVYLEDGYPDTTNKSFQTYWLAYQYSRSSSPYDIIIDLYATYVMDKIFIYSGEKPRFSVWATRDAGYAWEKIGEMSVPFNSWAWLDFRQCQCRFIKISFDLMDVGWSLPSGVTEGLLEDEWNGNIGRLNNLQLYGRPVSARPDGIHEPLRRSTVRKTVDQFFCTNGHAYQQGRIHSMCSGEHVRLYIACGHFAPRENGRLVPYGRVADMRFNVDDIPWVSTNSGIGGITLPDLLESTYKRHGLKPYITSTAGYDYCRYVRPDGTIESHCRQLDAYWLPDVWRPLPKRGVGGLDKYFGVTTDAHSYKTVAKLGYALAAKYGSRAVPGDGLFYGEDKTTGLDLVSGFETENEPDANWNKWKGYSASREYAAILSASADGHGATITDEDGGGTYGMRRAAPSFLAVASGTAGINLGYLIGCILHWRQTRPAADIPVSCINVHQYFSSIGNQGASSDDSAIYGVTADDALRGKSSALYDVIHTRDRMCPGTEVWITEFGYGEAGGRNTRSNYQCYSQAGRYIGDWLIPDRHRADVKGAWIVRAAMRLMEAGVDMVNYFSTECDGNYFGVGQWDSGAGFEMFHWNDCQDMTPGARTAHIQRFEHAQARGGFAVTGLFGNILSNGAYPISRAYWWVATMRNRLKGYVYAGRKYIEGNDKVMVYCFRHKTGDGGAYVVYYDDSRNTGVGGVGIPVPGGVSSYRRVTVHVPELPNPENVPAGLGWDRNRTGLPTSRKERYTGGKWVVRESEFELHTPSRSNAPAVYPENPVEGDEITVLPTVEENPYFPIVGPVGARDGYHVKNILTASEWEQDRELWQDSPQLDNDGNVIWAQKGNSFYAWRQVDAVCDYIDFHPGGVRGKTGDETVEEVIRGMIRTNVSEFPEFFFFDAVPEPDYRSEVTGLSSRTISSSAIELWWNNTSVEDTGYEIFVSALPETGYSPLKAVGLGVENKAVISGLAPDTTYYYKIRPVRDGKPGTMSDYVSARTYQDIQPPTGLRVEGRTATSIRLAWDYATGQVADFVGYAIYRADDTGAYAQAGTVEDQSVHAYEDTGLAVGRPYRYKVRVIGLNGTSAYTAEIETRTLLPEEVSPVIRTAITDKLGSKVILTFDLPIGIVGGGAKAGFALTEDGSLRLVRSVARDEANHNNLVLSIPQDSLADYDRRTDIRISYDGQGGILSGYGVALEGFSNVRVANVIGNFTNLEASFKINLTARDKTPPAGVEWNNCGWNAETESESLRLRDTYERLSTITLSTPRDNAGKVSFGTNTREVGVYLHDDIPPEVYKTGWDIRVGYTGRIRLSGLNTERRYTIRAYASRRTDGQTLTTMACGDYVSNSTSNTSVTGGDSFMALEDMAPVNGELTLDFSANDREYSDLNLILMEEYRSNQEPENTDVWLRDATVVEDDGGGVVKFPDVTIHLNCIGTVTAYRIGETPDLSPVDWVDIVNDTLDVPYTLSGGFGEKTLYVQVKNLYNESNIRVVNIEYKDPYVPLVLRNIYINNDDSITYAPDVTVMADKEGIPTGYRVAEVSDLSAVGWLDWPDPKGSTVPYRLSEGSGQKTVYMQVRDDITESAMRVDTIEYLTASGILTSITINGGAATTVSGDLTIGFVVAGTPTMMMLSESPDFAGATWKAFENPAAYTVSGLGAKTIYGKVKINHTLVSDVRTAGIELVETPPVPQGKRLAVSLSWERNEFDQSQGTNRISTANSKGGTGVRWNDGSVAGTFTAINVPANGYGTDKEGAATGNDSFDYPDEYMRHNSLVQVWNGIKSLEVKLSLPAGRYWIRLFNSTIVNQAYPLPFARYYVITGGYGTEEETKVEIPQPSGYTFVNNIAHWIEGEFDNGGEFYLRVETIRTGGTVTAPVNIIEIIPK